MWNLYNPLQGKILQILDHEGKVLEGAELPAIEPDEVVAAYRLMILARIADEKALSWQRQGRMYTFPPNLGQEAAAVGSAIALEKRDWLVPAFRELGAWLQRGVPLWCFYAYYGGYEKGTAFARETRVLPLNVPIASQVPQATGLGYALKLQGRGEAVLCHMGDGATSHGDFHEGLNFAGVWNVPVIFFINNNQYAISVSRSLQSASGTLAQKAVAYGLPGIQIDGNDFFAVYAATRMAAERARAGEGPALIEAVTYRMGAHTTSDDPSRYRTKEEEERWSERDPLKRLRAWLEAQELWDAEAEEAERAAAAAEAEAAFAEYESLGPYGVDQVFEHQFAELPPELAQQKVAYEKFLHWKESR